MDVNHVGNVIKINHLMCFMSAALSLEKCPLYFLVMVKDLEDDKEIEYIVKNIHSNKMYVSIYNKSLQKWTDLYLFEPNKEE